MLLKSVILQTQVINAVGNGGDGSGVDREQGSDAFGGDRARRRFRRNGGGSQKPPPAATPRDVGDDHKNASSFRQEDRHHRRQQQQQQQQHQNGQRQRTGHYSRRRRAGGNVNAGGRGRYGGWVDATVGGAGGGVPSTGGGIGDGGRTDPASPFSGAAWWSAGTAGGHGDDGENFAGDDGYAGVAGIGDTATRAGYTVAALVRRGWETGDKELAPRAPVFAADGQGYVSVAPVRDEQSDDGDDGDGDQYGGEVGVRLRRPSPKPHSPRDRNARGQSQVGKYYAQVVAVNITKKLLAPMTFGEIDDGDGDNDDKSGTRKRNVIAKSWTVVRILAWDQRTNMM